jgi:hypothetical protein
LIRSTVINGEPTQSLPESTKKLVVSTVRSQHRFDAHHSPVHQRRRIGPVQSVSLRTLLNAHASVDQVGQGVSLGISRRIIQDGERLDASRHTEVRYLDLVLAVSSLDLDETRIDGKSSLVQSLGEIELDHDRLALTGFEVENGRNELDPGGVVDKGDGGEFALVRAL